MKSIFPRNEFQKILRTHEFGYLFWHQKRDKATAEQGYVIHLLKDLSENRQHSLTTYFRARPLRSDQEKHCHLEHQPPFVSQKPREGESARVLYPSRDSVTLQRRVWRSAEGFPAGKLVRRSNSGFWLDRS